MWVTSHSQSQGRNSLPRSASFVRSFVSACRRLSFSVFNVFKARWKRTKKTVKQPSTEEMEERWQLEDERQEARTKMEDNTLRTSRARVCVCVSVCVQYILHIGSIDPPTTWPISFLSFVVIFRHSSFSFYSKTRRFYTLSIFSDPSFLFFLYGELFGLSGRVRCHGSPTASVVMTHGRPAKEPQYF